VALLGTVTAACAPAIPDAFGPFIRLQEQDFRESHSFRTGDRLVGTYYFYWYDIETKSHIIDHDGTDALTTHPLSLEDFSYKSVRWHRQQLEDMMAAGIDLLFPVFWGAPSEQNKQAGLHWSYAGLPHLVQAREDMLRQGDRPPGIGLFYDTSTLQYNAWGQHIDLTTDYGRQWFYATIRDFFALIPPKHWAMLDGRPMVLLYSAAFAKKHDQTCIEYVKEQFPKDFGGRVPWIAREISWQVRADSTVAWGGALGLKNPGVASLGPGYDHSAVPGRAPLVVDRQDGKFYEENWQRFLRRPASLLMVETWNEFHEGTDVCASREYGRQYIKLTRKYADHFKQGWIPPWPQGPHTGAPSVRLTLGAHNLEQGLSQVENEDGMTEPVTLAGREARAIQPTLGPGRYVYFSVHDSFKTPGAMNLELTVEFLDAAAGELGVEFDGSDLAAPFSGAYSRSPHTVKLTGDQTWRTVQFPLPRALLLHSQNRQADFRLVVLAPQFVVRQVTLRRPSP
jgi:hypothetical protein